MTVQIAASALAELRRLAAAAYPEEGCGVLVGTAGRIEYVRGGRNIAAERRRDRYELDPGAIVAAEREARGQGLEVIGFWHTHPDHPARPSGFDTERAWQEYLYMICSVTATVVGDVRAWRLDGEGFVEVPLHAVDAPARGTVQ